MQTGIKTLQRTRGHSSAAKHVSAVADKAESRTAQHTDVKADAATAAQHVSAVSDAASTQISGPGMPEEAAADGAPAHPLSSAASLQRSLSQQRGKKPSQKAVGAMWELLECSIAPQLQLDPGTASQNVQHSCITRTHLILVCGSQPLLVQKHENNVFRACQI